MLTSSCLIEFQATHLVAKLPGWQPCRRLDAHSYQAAVEYAYPESAAGPDDATALALIAAVGEVERHLHLANLNDVLADGSGEQPDED